MLLEVLPDALFKLSNINVLFKNETSAVLYKTLRQDHIDKKMYLAAVALLYVVKGSQTIKNYDGTEIKISEGEIVILPRDLYIVSDFVTRQNRFEAMIFFIGDALITKFLLFYSAQSKPAEAVKSVIKAKSNRQIVDFMVNLKAQHLPNSSRAALLEIKVIEFLILLGMTRETQALLLPLLQSKRRRGIKRFMEDNYRENLKIPDYATLTGRSISTFSREFKRLYGVTPNKWLIEKRLSKSHELLNHTSMNVTQIALTVGYDNISHFIKAYKQRYGLTPKATQNRKND